MDTVSGYRQIIQDILRQYEQVQYANGDFHNEIIFDQKADRYLVMSIGWDNRKRLHSCLIHLDVIDGKVWVQRDGTEDGIANKLIAAGIPKHHIVLGFQPEDVRSRTEFAVA